MAKTTKETKNYGTLKAGEYYVGDWCYAIEDEVEKDALCDALIEREKELAAGEWGFKFKWNDGEMLVVSCEDDIYHLNLLQKGSTEFLTVDAGSICLIPRASLKASDDFLKHHGTIVTIDEDVEVKQVIDLKNSGRFNLSIGDLFEIQ